MRGDFNAAAAAHTLKAWGVNYSRENNGALLIKEDIWGKGPQGMTTIKKMRQLAKQVLGDENAVLVYNMAEFSEPLAMHRLTGAPPGFIGSDEGSPLANQIRRMPNVLLILDEIEKADPRVMKALDEILSQGVINASSGTKTSLEGIIPVKISQEVSQAEWQHRREAAIERAVAGATVLQAPLTVGRALKYKNRFALA
jgi:hypothetical protein